MSKVRVCAIEGCEKLHFGRGWCRLHYQRWYHHGDPSKSPADRRREVARRIAEMVAQGMSDPQIGEALGLKADAVGQRRRQAGIKSQWKPPRAPHGTASRYVRGCRCDDCRDAATEAARGPKVARRGVTPKTHGLAGYTNYGCRCEVCSQAARGAGRQFRERRQVRSLEGAIRYRAEWTGPELEIIARRDMSIAETARLLGRTYSAVSAARKRVKDDPRFRNLAGLPKVRGAQR